jgi:hypothetical protein
MVDVDRHLEAGKNEGMIWMGEVREVEFDIQSENTRTTETESSQLDV